MYVVMYGKMILSRNLALGLHTYIHTYIHQKMIDIWQRCVPDAQPENRPSADVETQ